MRVMAEIKRIVETVKEEMIRTTKIVMKGEIEEDLELSLTLTATDGGTAALSEEWGDLYPGKRIEVRLAPERITTLEAFTEEEE